MEEEGGKKKIFMRLSTYAAFLSDVNAACQWLKMDDPCL